MKLIILLLTLALSASCSHDKLIHQAHVSGNCSEKIKDITPPADQGLLDLTKQATAGSVSIAITGAGAATDALIIILTNPLTKISLCVATVSIILSGASVNTDICNYATDPSYNPKLAQKALDHTISWRCPNLDYISEGLRKVATCYSDKNEKDKAKLQLQNILRNKTIYECIYQEEALRVENEIAQI